MESQTEQPSWKSQEEMDWSGEQVSVPCNEAKRSAQADDVTHPVTGVET